MATAAARAPAAAAASPPPPPQATMEQDSGSSLPSLSPLKLYVQEEGAHALNRIRSKILGTAAVTAVGSTIWATGTNRPAMRIAPALTANAAVAVTAFAVCQEGVRAVRHGDNDGWNSFVAGGMTGAALTRIAYGRGFHLLGAVLWAPLCGTLHWANHKLQAAATIQAWLAQHDLLDLPQHQLQQQQQLHQHQQQLAYEQQQQQQQQPPKVPVSFEDMPWQDKVRAVEEIKQREMAQLHQAMRDGEQAAREAELQQRRQQHSSSRRWWALW